jgi:hypothetical protein
MLGRGIPGDALRDDFFDRVTIVDFQPLPAPFQVTLQVTPRRNRPPRTNKPRRKVLLRRGLQNSGGGTRTCGRFQGKELHSIRRWGQTGDNFGERGRDDLLARPVLLGDIFQLNERLLRRYQDYFT